MKSFCVNRRVPFDYEIQEKLEAGLVLTGAEVKSIREGKMSLEGSFVRLLDREAWLYNAYIHPYSYSRDESYDSRKPRKLLLHRQELAKIDQRIREKGLTLVPTACYNKKGKIKLEIGLGRGKKQYEKREILKRRDIDRETARAMRSKG